VQPLPIVILLDEFCDVHTHVPKVFVSVRVDFFSFQGFHEALATGIGMSIQLRRMATSKLDVSE
jgi:hypothetical protein